MGEARRRGLMGLPSKPARMEVPIRQLTDRVCDCTCKAFTKVYGLKELPALYSPSGKMETMMLHVGFACAACRKMMPLVAGDPLPSEEQAPIKGDGENGSDAGIEEPATGLVQLK